MRALSAFLVFFLACASGTGKPKEKEKVPPTLPEWLESVFPEPGAQNVSVKTFVIAKFKVDIDPTSINSSTFYLSGVTADVEYFDRTAVLMPKTPLEYGKEYIATLKGNIRKSDGEEVGEDFSWSFTTQEKAVPPEITHPWIKDYHPENGATDVSINVTVWVAFTTDIAPETLPDNFLLLHEGQKVPSTVSYDENSRIATLKPDKPLEYEETYVAAIMPSLKNKEGEELGDYLTWYFTTESKKKPVVDCEDLIPPEVTFTYPQDGAVDIPADANIVVEFSEDVTGVNASTIYIISQTGSPVIAQVTYDEGARLATVDPTYDLEKGYVYTVYITKGIKDKCGNPLKDEVSFYFKVEEEEVPPGPVGVIITSPGSGEIVSGTITIETDVTGDVEKAELYIDDALISTDNEPPYQFPWDTNTLTDGTHDFKVVVYSPAGQTADDTVTLIVDNTAPSISFSYPQDGNYVSGDITVKVVAGDKNGVKYVDLYIDGMFYKTVSSPPDSTYDFQIKTSDFADGEHTLKASTEDVVGNKSSAQISVFFDNNPPSVSISSPTSGKLVSGTVKIEVTAEDTVGVKKVLFFANSVRICDAISGSCEDKDSPYVMNWSTEGVTYGVYTLEVTAYDFVGFTASDSITVVVDNLAPTVSIQAPKHGSYVSGTTTVRVDADDMVGVSKVEFYVDGDLIASDSFSPYEFSWVTSDSTLHTLRAVAHDSAGNSSYDEIQVYTDNLAPTIYMASPQDGGCYKASTELKAYAYDMTKVLAWGDGTSEEFQGYLTWTPVSQVKVEVRDGQGNVQIEGYDDGAGRIIGNYISGSINYNTGYVYVEITSPSPVPNGWPIVVLYNSSSTYKVKRVDFWLNLVLTASDSDWEFSTMVTPSEGLHRVTAVALDRANNYTISDSVDFSIDNSPPFASIKAPAEGNIYSGNLTVWATIDAEPGCADEGGVKFYVKKGGETKVSVNDSESPYYINWNTTYSEDGTYTAEVVAYDSVGNEASPISVTFMVDNNPPSVSIITPQNNSGVRCPIGITAQVTDVIGVDKVIFKVDKRVGASWVQVDAHTDDTNNASPYSHIFSTGCEDGTFRITVEGYDLPREDGTQLSLQSQVLVTADNTPPTVEIESPNPWTYVSGTYSVEVTASDAVYLRCVTLYVKDAGGTTVQTYSECPNVQGTRNITFLWNTKQIPDNDPGNPSLMYYVLEVKATDLVYNTAVSQVTAVVDNTAPSVTITNPPLYSGISTIQQGTIPVTASVDDALSGVKKVAFYIASNDSVEYTYFGVATPTAPYSADVSAVLDTTSYCGDYDIKVLAYDWAGNIGEDILETGTSNFVRIQNPGCPILDWVRSPGRVQSSPTLYDIDGDGILEIVFGTKTRWVYAYNYLGEIEWARATDDQVVAPVAITDVDIDASAEVMVGDYSGGFYIFNGNTGSSDSQLSLGSILFSPPSAPGYDLNGDGYTDIAVGGTDGVLNIIYGNSFTSAGAPVFTGECIGVGDAYCPVGRDPLTGGDLNSDGQPDILVAPIIWDIDADTVPEIVFSATDGYLYVVTGTTRRLKWDLNIGSIIYSSPIIYDVDLNGDYEIFFGDDSGYFWCIEPTGSGCNFNFWNLGQSYTQADGAIRSSPAIGDVDVAQAGDEIVFTSMDGNVYILSVLTGGLVAEYDVNGLESPNEPMFSSPILADITGDGISDIIVATMNGNIYAISVAGGSVTVITGYPIQTGGQILSTPSVGDLDGDGTMELVVGSEDGRIYMWDLGPGSANAAPWPMFRKDVSRTGR